MQVSGIAIALRGDALKCKTDYANNTCKSIISTARPNRPGTRVHFRIGGVTVDNSITNRLAMNCGRMSWSRGRRRRTRSGTH